MQPWVVVTCHKRNENRVSVSLRVYSMTQNTPPSGRAQSFSGELDGVLAPNKIEKYFDSLKGVKTKELGPNSHSGVNLRSLNVQIGI